MAEIWFNGELVDVPDDPTGGGGFDFDAGPAPAGGLLGWLGRIGRGAGIIADGGAKAAAAVPKLLPSLPSLPDLGAGLDKLNTALKAAAVIAVVGAGVYFLGPVLRPAAKAAGKRIGG